LRRMWSGVAPIGALTMCGDLAERDLLGRSRLSARGLFADLQPVVAQRAFVRAAVLFAQIDDAVRAGRYAVAAAVTNIVLNDHRAEFAAENRTRRAHIQTGGMCAVFAHVR